MDYGDKLGTPKPPVGRPYDDRAVGFSATDIDVISEIEASIVRGIMLSTRPDYGGLVYDYSSIKIVNLSKYSPVKVTVSIDGNSNFFVKYLTFPPDKKSYDERTLLSVHDDGGALPSNGFDASNIDPNTSRLIVSSSDTTDVSALFYQASTLKSAIFNSSGNPIFANIVPDPKFFFGVSGRYITASNTDAKFQYSGTPITLASNVTSGAMNPKTNFALLNDGSYIDIGNEVVTQVTLPATSPIVAFDQFYDYWVLVDESDPASITFYWTDDPASGSWSSASSNVVGPNLVDVSVHCGVVAHSTGVKDAYVYVINYYNGTVFALDKNLSFYYPAFFSSGGMLFANAEYNPGYSIYGVYFERVLRFGAKVG